MLRYLARASLILFLLVIGGCKAGMQQQAAIPLPDTSENRLTEAKRYMETMPPEKMFHDLAENMVSMMPATQATQLKELFTKHIDLEAHEAFMLESMTKHFTAEELQALADFYGSPVGQSVMEKFGKYMAESMPFMQEQAISAIQKAQKEGEL